MKEKWEQPQLIVAVRGRPEETLETGCKTSSDVGPEISVVGSTCNFGGEGGPNTACFSASGTS